MSASSKKKLRKELSAAALTEKQLQEQKEAKKLKTISVVFIAVMIVVAITAAAVLIVRAVNNSGVIDRNTVAATVDDNEIDSLQMNYYYIDYIQDFYAQWYAQYGDYTGMYMLASGLDMSKPLNEQFQDQENGVTWADYFLQEALARAKNDYALYNKAMEENYTLTKSEQLVAEYNIDELEYYAAMRGYSNVEKYIKALYGAGADLESFEKYNNIMVTATAYYNNHNSSLTFDDAAIREHGEEHFDKFSAFSFASYYVNTGYYLGEPIVNENGLTVYTDAQKETARAAAESTAKKLVAAKNVEELNKAIAALDYNKDVTDVGCEINTDIPYASVPSAMQEWLSDKDRVQGDITYVANELSSFDDAGNPTTDVGGYYVVIYQGRNDNLRHLANVRHLLVKFEGGTTDSTTGVITYSEDEKAAAKAEAEVLLESWKTGKATEESFIALVKEHSDDTTASTGGLIEDIHRDSNYVTNFKDWAVDSERKAGDTAVVESEYGYHVMYYVGDDPMTYREYLINEDLRAITQQEWFEDIVENVEAAIVETKRLNLDIAIASTL